MNPTICAAFYTNTIYDGMKGLRLFERFGFSTPKEKKAAQPARVVTDYDEWIFSPANHVVKETE